MSETARLLADGVEGFLSRSDRLDPEALHASLVEGGFALVLAEESQGGLGATWGEASVVARSWGRHAAPLPIVELLLAAKVAGSIGRADLATRLTFAPATLLGRGTSLAAAYPGANLVVVQAHAPNPILGTILGAERSETLAGEACWRVGGTQTEAVEGAACPPGLQLLRWGTLLTVACMLGAMERVVEMMIEHATVRTQFGRPLARFQLIQVLLADAASEVAATQAILESALRSLDAGHDDPLLWYAAKSQAGAAATIVAANAHQLFGAIGFTQEHALQRYTRRLWAWRDAWLPQAVAEDAIGRYAAAAGGEGLWSRLADAPGAGGAPS